MGSASITDRQVFIDTVEPPTAIDNERYSLLTSRIASIYSPVTSHIVVVTFGSSMVAKPIIRLAGFPSRYRFGKSCMALKNAFPAASDDAVGYLKSTTI
ncbi:MAG: hypothetical protein ACFFFB_17350 [Candidatus Heimdallarchaeota archaeon]